MTPKSLPRLSVDERSLTEHFTRSSGPGGQNVNKVSTSVELRCDLSTSGLPDPVKARLVKLAGHRMTSNGIIVIHAHEHRTQLQNREAARRRLADLLTRAARAPRARRSTKPDAASRERRLSAKTRRGQVKRLRARARDEE